jgi:transcriptional regulator with XRE-family HTH domain
VKIIHRIKTESPELSNRLRLALAGFGKSTATARAVGLTPQKITNYSRGHVVSIQLDQLLALEDYLQVDLLGKQRDAIVSDLISLAKKISRRGAKCVDLPRDCDYNQINAQHKQTNNCKGKSKCK